MSYRYLDQIIDICRGAPAPAFMHFSSARRLPDGSFEEWSSNVDPVDPMDKVTGYRFTELRRASRNGREVLCAISLFGDIPQASGRGKPKAARTKDNARFVFDLYSDVDNTEYKAKRASLQDETERSKFLLESQTRLYDRLTDRLKKAGLLPFVAILNSGSGYHLHFILSELFDLSLSYDIAGKASSGAEYYSFTAKQLVELVDADPSKSNVSDTGKWLPGTWYHKEKSPIEVIVMKDAERFATLEELNNLLGIARLNLPAIEKAARPLADQPGVWSFDGTPYTGKPAYSNGNGTFTHIYPDWSMRLKIPTGAKDEENEAKFKVIPLQNDWAIFPKWRVEKAKKDIYYIVEARYKEERKLLSIPLNAMNSADTLTKILNENEITMHIGKMACTLLFAYIKNNSTTIRAVDIEASQELYSSFDFLCRNGVVYQSSDGIVETGNGGVFHLRGADIEGEMRNDDEFVRPGPVNARAAVDAFKGFETRLNAAYKDKRMNSLYLSFLAAGMLRDKLVKKFSEFPFLGLFGEGSTGKTSLMEFAQSIYNVKMITDPSVFQITRKAENFKNHILLLNEINGHEKFIQYFKDASGSGERTRQTLSGDQRTTHIKNSIMFSTNEVFSDDALDSRVIHLKLTTDNMSDPLTFEDLKNYVDDNKFDIFMGLYEKVRGIDFQELVKTIRQVRMTMTQFVKNSRVATLYSILIAVGATIGLDIDASEIISYAEKRIAASGGSQTELASAILEFVIEDRKKAFTSPPQEMSAPPEYLFPLADLTAWLKVRNFDQFVTSRSLGKEIRKGSFAETETHNMYHHDKLVNGVWVNVKLTNAIFKSLTHGLDAHGKVILYRIEPQGGVPSTPQPAF